MSVYRRGKFYWYDFERNGKRHHHSTAVPVGVKDAKKTAEDIERTYRLKLAREEAGIYEPDPAPAFTDFTERFQKWVAAQRKEKPSTVLFYKTKTNELLKFEPFKTAKLDEIDAGLIAKFVEWRQGCKRTTVIRRRDRLEYVESKRLVSVAGINRELAVLRRILRIAREWQVIQNVPTIHLLPGEKNRERVITHDEEKAYLAGAKDLLKDFMALLFDTGLRPQDEARQLRWENVHFKPVGKAIYGYIHNPKGKTSRAKRNIPMTSRVKTLLEARHEAAGKPNFGYVFAGPTPKEPVSYTTITSQHRRLIKKQKIVAFVPYDARHTFLTRLGESGADSFTIQNLAGHSTILMSQRYVHPTPERIESALTNLEQYNLGKEQESQKKAAEVS